jgi:spore germination protein D
LNVHKLSRIVVITCVILFLTSCGSGKSSGGMQNYKDTKSMVIDILESEEAKKVIQKASAEQSSGGKEGIKLLSTPEGKQIQIAVKDILTDPKYSKHLEKMMTDPKFAGEFAKAISKENKQLQKDLMKDPEYQAMLVGVMKNPEFEKILLDTLKGTEYRKQAAVMFQEALDNPLFKVELMTLMKKVLEEEAKPKKKEGGQ